MKMPSNELDTVLWLYRELHALRIFSIYLLYVCDSAMCMSDDNFQDLILSYHVSPKDWTVRFGGYQL